MKYIIIFLFFITFNVSAENIFEEFDFYYKKGDFVTALKKTEKKLLKIKFSPSLGELAKQYIKLSQKLNKNPMPFLKKLLKKKLDYLEKERIVLAIADYYFMQGVKSYYRAIYFYTWIEKNHNKKSLVIDDAFWSLYKLYKKIGAYNNSIIYLNKIIARQEYSFYVASYNYFQLYDAYLEKAKIEYHIFKKTDSAIRTLNIFLINYPDNDLSDDAMYFLCKIGFDIENKELKKKCCDIKSIYPYSSILNKANKLCENY